MLFVFVVFFYKENDMKKAKKNMKKNIQLVIIFALIIIFSINSVCIAAPSASFPTGGTVDTTVRQATGKIWGSVVKVVQILAFAAIVFAGLRYMFASADGKADIKRGLIILALGAVLVFATTTIVSLVVDSADQLI